MIDDIGLCSSRTICRSFQSHSSIPVCSLRCHPRTASHTCTYCSGNTTWKQIFVRYPTETRMPCFTHSSRTRSAHPVSSFLVRGAVFWGLKRRRRRARHQPLSRAKVRNAWSSTFTPTYPIMAWSVIKHSEDFAIYYYAKPQTLSLIH
jgi:hypothetical protein